MPRTLRTCAWRWPTSSSSRTAFGHAAAHYHPLLAAGETLGLNALAAGYGPALVDRAILDALCRVMGLSFNVAIRGNAPGIDGSLTADLAGFDLDPAARVLIVFGPVTRWGCWTRSAGMMPLRAADGLPQTLEQSSKRTGTATSAQLGGNQSRTSPPDQASPWLSDCRSTPSRSTATSSFADVATIAEFWRRAAATPSLARLTASTFVSGTTVASRARFETDVSQRASKVLLIDDPTRRSMYPRRARSATRCPSKSARALQIVANAARCALWNRAAPVLYFFSA